jgi:formate/nitrite transporter FocA (FNT family)
MHDESKNKSAAGEEGKEKSVVTDRSEERTKEDEQFIPVIVKRTDEAKRHPDDTLERAVKEGLEQIRRRTVSLALSSMAAGLILGFTAMAVAVVSKAVAPWEAPLLSRLAAALVYPLGFVICVLSGTQLFTEHTAMAVYPVLDQKASLWGLLRLWLIVIVGNLFGAAISANLLAIAEPVISAREGYVEIGEHLVGFAALPLLVSAVLAGWLMAQGAWLVLGTPHTTGQILSIYMVTFVIGIGGLHHSIAGAVEMFIAMLVDEQFTAAQAVRFIGLALLGNTLGGSMFVAVLNYGHIRGTQSKSTTSQKVD